MGWDVLSLGREGSESPPEGLGGVRCHTRRARRNGRPSRRARSGWEALLEGQRWLEGPPRGPGGVSRPFWWAARAWEGWEGLGGPSGGPGGIKRPTRRAVRGWEGLGGPLRGPGKVGWSFPRARRGLGPPGGSGRVGRIGTGREGWEDWEAFLEARDGSGVPSRVLGRVRRAGRGQESHPECQERLVGAPGGPGGVGSPNQ